MKKIICFVALLFLFMGCSVIAVASDGLSLPLHASIDGTVLDVTDVLVSMLDEHKNYCSYFMKKGGVEKLHLLEVISKKRNKELKKSKIKTIVFNKKFLRASPVIVQAGKN